MATKDERTELELLKSIDKRLSSIATWVGFMGVILLITVVVSACSAIIYHLARRGGARGRPRG